MVAGTGAGGGSVEIQAGASIKTNGDNSPGLAVNGTGASLTANNVSIKNSRHRCVRRRQRFRLRFFGRRRDKFDRHDECRHIQRWRPCGRRKRQRFAGHSQRRGVPSATFSAMGRSASTSRKAASSPRRGQTKSRRPAGSVDHARPVGAFGVNADGSGSKSTSARRPSRRPAPARSASSPATLPSAARPARSQRPGS